MVKIETFKTWVIFILMGIIAFMYFFHECETDCPEVKIKPTKRHVEIKDSVEDIKQHIDTVQKNVAKENKQIQKHRQAVKAIKYKTTFDSTATIDTVKVELIKADSVVHELDSIDVDQEQVNDQQASALDDCKKAISLLEEDKKAMQTTDKENKREIRKLKHRIFWTKVGAVAVVAGTVVLVIVIL